MLPVPKFLAKTDISVEIGEGTDENGVLNVVDKFNVKCRFEESNSSIYTKDGAKVTLKAKAFIFDELSRFPDDVSGFCTINDIKYDIAHSSKKFNPDATINHVVLELM